jgi:hypothetical protein
MSQLSSKPFEAPPVNFHEISGFELIKLIRQYFHHLKMYEEIPNADEVALLISQLPTSDKAKTFEIVGGLMKRLVFKSYTNYNVHLVCAVEALYLRYNNIAADM